MPYVHSFYGDLLNKKMKYYFDVSILRYIFKYFTAKEIYAQRYQIINSLFAEVFLPFKYRSSFSRIIERLLRIHLIGEPSPFPINFAYANNRPPSYFEAAIKMTSFIAEYFQESGPM